MLLLGDSAVKDGLVLLFAECTFIVLDSATYLETNSEVGKSTQEKHE